MPDSTEVERRERGVELSVSSMLPVPRNEHFVGRVYQDFYRQWPAAEDTRRHTLSLKEEIFRKAQVQTLVRKNELVSALDKQGKYEEAAAMNKETLVLAERVLGREHPETLISMSNMGRVLGHQGKYEEAEIMNRQTLAVFETLLGREDPETLASMSNVALMLGLQGKYEEAEAMNRQTLALKETVLGREHPQTLTSMSNLVGVLELQGKFNEAEAMIVQMLALKETLLGEEHHETLTCISQLGSVLQMQGKYEEAIPMHRRTLQGREKLLGQEHPDTLTSISQLESVLELQRKYEEEESFVGHYEAKPDIVIEASEGSGTYVGQVVKSQDETLNEREETTTTSKKISIDILDDSSIASHTTTGREKLGKDYIARFLADDGEMRVLCSSVLDKTDREHFVDIGRQILKSFYLSLAGYAKTELEKQGARLLKSRSGRKRICEDIADIIKSQDTQNEKEKERAAEQHPLAEHRLEMFTKDVLDLDHPPEIEGALPTDDNYEGVVTESESETEYENLPNLARLKEFFRESEPFQVLLNDLRIQLLPLSLKDIIQTVPHGSVWLSDQDNHSLSNRMKAFVEDFTVLEWNWWPFEPRMEKLGSNEMRLFWHCSCGTRLWQEISWQDADLIKPMLLNQTTESGSLRRCKQNKRLTSLVKEFMAFTASQSAAGQRYTPTSIGISTNATHGSQGTGTGLSIDNLSNPVQATNQVAGPGIYTNMGQQASPSDPRILFGVKGPNPALKLEQIEIRDTTMDSNFYDELKKHYRLNRGKFRYWFSFWRLGYCEVVKFQTYRPKYVLKEHKELPTSDEYDYLPRPPDAQNPPVSRHEFSMHINACGDSCRWALLKNYAPGLGNILHDCLPRLNTKRAIKRIPKKKSPFDTSSTDDEKAYAWGLEARHEISAIYVLFYHLLILALPFGFWGWWQATHPGDVQNASIPVTVALTMLSLFWGTNGILTQGRKLGETRM